MELQDKIERAKELLRTVRHAAMATVNEDGSPHNTPYFFMRSPDLKYLYWSSHPDSEHSKNVARTGQAFVVLYDARERGGLFIKANEAHIAEGPELEEALSAYNDRRVAEGADPIPLNYYRTAPQRMYIATVQQLWVNKSDKDVNGVIIQDKRYEITCGDLLG